MFDEIAGRYDLLNAVLSLGIDRVWRREAAHWALAGGAARLLDVATGTGDLALEIKRRRPEARVVAIDFAEPMLQRARAKAGRRGLDVDWQLGDALRLPFGDGSFDAVTVAYGLRNLADLEAGLRECLRVLRPGGRLVALEFPPPPDGPLGIAYRLYFTRLLPALGGLLSGSPAAYSYLPASVLAFPDPASLARLLQGCGFGAVRYRLQSGGISAIFVAERPS